MPEGISGTFQCTFFQSGGTYSVPAALRYVPRHDEAAATAASGPATGGETDALGVAAATSTPRPPSMASCESALPQAQANSARLAIRVTDCVTAPSRRS
jgi:hypothetical protein